MPGEIPQFSDRDRAFLFGLQHQSLTYFLENQGRDGLVRDRQAGHGPLRQPGWYSTSATGMGLVAVSLAAAEPYRLIPQPEAILRVRTGLETAFTRLRHDHGILPHFLDVETGAVVGTDAFSTIDSAWLIAGGLWAAAFLRDAGLQELAGRLYDRVDWTNWTEAEVAGSRDLIRHGAGADGKLFPGAWDRLDGETVHLYALAIGAAPARALPPRSWDALGLFYGTVSGYRFNNADLGLFAFQYGLDLLDFRRWRRPDGVDLAGEATRAVRANYLFCRECAARFATYRRFWGLSDGDGPGDPPVRDAYRAYGPGQPVDGTAHLTATLASVAAAPDEALGNLREAERDTALGARGRYGFASVNLDRGWVASEQVGIDAGAAVLALDNVLCDNRVRRVFHGLPCVARALELLGFRAADQAARGDADGPSVRDAV